MGLSVTISAADAQDAEHILKLQYLCYQSEAELYGDWSIEPLTQSLDALRAELDEGHGLVARLGDEVVASVRARLDEDGTVRIAKLIVHPRMRRHGLGGRSSTASSATSPTPPSGLRRPPSASGSSPVIAARAICASTAARATPRSRPVRWAPGSPW